MSLNSDSHLVIITTYNSSAYIEKSIKSVLNQTIKVSNILIIDDNSADVFILKKIILLRKIMFKGTKC